MTDVELRRLELRDLNAIEEIERSSYPTPWSRSMFASELAKPSSLCLGAFEAETGKLIGYLIISRYVDAWHVMNVAVTPDQRRRGIASLLLNRLFELTAGRSRRGYTLEVRVSNAGAIKLYEEVGFRPRQRAVQPALPGLERVWLVRSDETCACMRGGILGPIRPQRTLGPHDRLG